MKRKKIGVAVVGSGRIGTLRARLAAKHPAVNFLAISDLDPQRARALAEPTAPISTPATTTRSFHVRKSRP